jgi:hypothetical protein
VHIPGHFNGHITVALLDHPPSNGIGLIIRNDATAISPTFNMPRCVVTRSKSRAEECAPPGPPLSLESLFEVSERGSADPLTEDSEDTAADNLSGEQQQQPGEGVTVDQQHPLKRPEEIRHLQESDPTLASARKRTGEGVG